MTRVSMSLGCVALLGSLLFARGNEEKSLVHAFLSKLKPEQRASAVLPFDHEARMGWAYVPGRRAGVVLKELTPPQKDLVADLLRAHLSEDGFRKVVTIRNEVEQALRQLEGNPGRDSELYYIAFFGAPSAKEGETWGMRFEGHHISLNFTFRGPEMVSSSPQFLGSNPAEVREGPHKGLRVLKEEEDLARELVRSLDEAQRRAAVLSDRAPADLLTSNQRQASILSEDGLAYAQMSDTQKSLFQKLVKTYAGVQRDRQFKARMKKVEVEGWNGLLFAWMGGTEQGQGHYYRIQGKSFLIEYDNTQNGANHVHSVWRDLKGDFGRDALAEHYRSSPHHRR